VLAAGIARRRGDIAGLREAWSGIEPLLARRTADLWQIEAIEELAVAAARLRRHARVEPVLDLLDRIIASLDRPFTWSVSLGWIRLQVAIVAEDGDAVSAVAGRLTALAAAAPPDTAAARSDAAAGPANAVATHSDALARPPDTEGAPPDAVAAPPDMTAHDARPLAQCAAAARWADVLGGRIEPEAVLAAAEDLNAAELPWEASRLAGQAAIRTADPTAARRLLERARELSDPDATSAASPSPASPTTPGGLSEREITVARLVLAGSTHREIGAQLYIAPKTVEHHVARIRGKLRASTRAELLATLREMFGD
jgi:DNA-binding NarL/FixJ family response regulator